MNGKGLTSKGKGLNNTGKGQRKGKDKGVYGKVQKIKEKEKK